MRTALILLLALAANSALADTQIVWKWVDERGVTHYSDRPVPGATQVQLNVAGSRSSPSAPASSTSAPQRQPRTNTPAPSDQVVYRNFEIWKPLREETIANTGGVVQVNVRVDPALSAQHRLTLYLDGKRVEGFPENTAEFELKDVPRGMHTVVATITDPAGTRIQETERIVFYVRQESTANPPVGPSMRPPPKPSPRGASNKLPTSQPSYAALNGSKNKPVDPNTNRPPVTRPATTPGPRSGN